MTSLHPTPDEPDLDLEAGLADVSGVDEEDDDWVSGYADDGATGEWDLEERYALRRVAGLRTELEDITEVEYRQLRLERVVLVGVWTEGTAEDADNSLAELALLAETAGSLVLDGVIQRRDKPD